MKKMFVMIIVGVALATMMFTGCGKMATNEVKQESIHVRSDEEIVRAYVDREFGEEYTFEIMDVEYLDEYGCHGWYIDYLVYGENGSLERYCSTSRSYAAQYS